jgi:uncharacterized damage-inducible protein DinB
MDIKKIIAMCLENTGYQLEKCFEGMREDTLDLRICPTTRTPREHMIHLCDVYNGYLKAAAGEEYEWGSFEPSDTSFEGLKKTLQQLRGQAVEQALKAKNEQAVADAFDYIQAHECYHIGQICLTRIQNEPDWDPYSIYPS